MVGSFWQELVGAYLTPQSLSLLTWSDEILAVVFQVLQNQKSQNSRGGHALVCRIFFEFM